MKPTRKCRGCEAVPEARHSHTVTDVNAWFADCRGCGGSALIEFYKKPDGPWLWWDCGGPEINDPKVIVIGL